MTASSSDVTPLLYGPHPAPSGSDGPWPPSRQAKQGVGPAASSEKLCFLPPVFTPHKQNANMCLEK